MSCFSFSCFLTLQCKFINQLYNIQTFSIEASAKPAASRKYLAQSALAKVISLKRMALPGAKITRKALDTWNSRTQMEMKKGKHTVGNTGHSCNRSMYVKGKNMKTEKHMKTMKDYEKESNLLWGQAKKRLANVETDPNFGRW